MPHTKNLDYSQKTLIILGDDQLMSFTVSLFQNNLNLRFCFGIRLGQANGENRRKQFRKYPGNTATTVAKVGKNSRVFILVIVLVSI